MKYDRSISLSIKLINAPEYDSYRGSLNVKDLKVSFSIFKSMSWSTNTAKISIWNLSKNTRNELVNIGDEVSLFAGYKNEGGESLIFRGDTTQLEHSFPKPDIITNLTCGDGDKIINNKKIALSFGENTPVKAVIENIVSQMDMNIHGKIPEINDVYALGFQGSNLARNLLDTVCNKANLKWGVQNGNLLFNRRGEGSLKPPVDINVNTGMLGVPERYTDKKGQFYVVGKHAGWKVRTLLRPDILPDDIIRLQSIELNFTGLFVVETIQHDGDNYGENFESTIEVLPV